MRQRFIIIITIAIVLAVFVGLNAASYVRIERSRDSEFNPDRSTYNSGATGTRALYDFLNEGGHRVVRWREAPAALLNYGGSVRPETFVIVGETIVPFEKEEAESLLRWVEAGGRLVLIDRRPDARLLPPSGHWGVSTELLHYPTPAVHSDNPEEMTAGVTAVRAAQPTLLTRDVDSVMPSRFAGLINLSWAVGEEANTPQPEAEASPEGYQKEDEEFSDDEQPPPLVPAHGESPPLSSAPEVSSAEPVSPAPIIHLANKQGALLVDYPHGAGRITILSDPFIVANGGISRADNLPLAINVVAGRGGLVAFDEYHQGHGQTRNQLASYFAGTPVLAIFAHAALIVLAVLWTSGRRFARPLPAPREDRRSKLEFVASMAELQQRSRAYDLAIENIYTRTRRALVRYAGAEHNTPRREIAARISARSSLDREQLEKLMRECEDAINGEPINERQSLSLVARLRQVEGTLGIRMRSREVKQSVENR